MKKTNDLTICIIAKDEEERLKKLLPTLSWAKEIVVIDDNSKDKTSLISKKYTKKVYKKTLRSFSAQRNFGLKKSTSSWVLFLDSDESITNALKREITQSIKDEKVNGYYLIRSDYFNGKKLLHGEWGNQKLLRLARKDKNPIWIRNVHEVWKVEGIKKTLKNHLVHTPHETVSEFVESINKQAKLHSLALSNEKKNFKSIRLFVNPPAKFIKNYFLLKGYKDKKEGFVYAVMMSFHSFIAWSYICLKKQKK